MFHSHAQEKPTTCSLVVTTYNTPHFLQITLEYLTRLRVMPDEIIVADDGSGEPTREIVESYRSRFPVPVKHVWHEDRGFRAAAIRNRAIEAAEGEYIIFIDGDIPVDKDFVSDHLRMARRDTFVTGSRCCMDEAATVGLMRLPADKLPAFRALVHGLKSYRLPLLTKLFYRRKSKDPVYIRSCNMAIWKKDLEKVNGFNEDFEGWGHEDTELSWRLVNAGLKKRYIKYGAVCCHLYHGRDKSRHSLNEEKMIYARDHRLTRITNGLRVLSSEQPDNRD